ncbi:uncharacterized protein [Halyomorpha halys]|uniref:uncharacterized protein isoform X2 n=1 Tax=Halyomorpha halys TaxID=286706 RepID=UPI000D0C7A63|nr:uncharacterized protein LOC106685074 isoform X2 [Halyomorpha halys]
MTSFFKRNLFLIVITLLTYSELGQGLVCFVCHSRSEDECLDPFVGNKTDAIDCKRVRDVGLGVIAAASGLGFASSKYSALDQPPHVCFKWPSSCTRMRKT